MTYNDIKKLAKERVDKINECYGLKLSERDLELLTCELCGFAIEITLHDHEELWRSIETLNYLFELQNVLNNKGTIGS